MVTWLKHSVTISLHGFHAAAPATTSMHLLSLSLSLFIFLSLSFLLTLSLSFSSSYSLSLSLSLSFFLSLLLSLSICYAAWLTEPIPNGFPDRPTNQLLPPVFFFFILRHSSVELLNVRRNRDLQLTKRGRRR
jgi:hypothetical protein